MKLHYRIQNALDNLRARYQRSKRGYSYGDVWNMCDWFMRTVKPMLIHLKYNGVSYPSEFKDRSEWQAVLEEMIDCLDFMDENIARQVLGVSDDFSPESYKKIAGLMNKNRNRFFELFSKYFYDLWD